MSEPLVLPDGYIIDSLDVVYPPIPWNLVWLKDWPESQRPYLPMLQSIGMCIEPWVAGWYLMCGDTGGAALLTTQRDAYDTKRVMAYTSGHARHLLGL